MTDEMRVETILHYPSMLRASCMDQDLFELLYHDEMLSDAIGLYLSEDEWERADADRAYRDDELMPRIRSMDIGFAVRVTSPVEDSWGHYQSEWRVGNELSPLLPGDSE